MATNMTTAYTDILFKKVPVAPLISFKLIFGVLMVFSTVRFMYLGWIEDHYLAPVFHFKYYGFEWVQSTNKFLLYSIHYLMIAAALGVMFCTGFVYRIAAIVLFVCFTYTELIDLTYYLNHYYFVSLVCLILIFIPAKHSVFKGDLRGGIPNWAIIILKFQIALVYIYAGIAKINYDWLIDALPLKIWVPANDALPIVGPIFTWAITPYLFSWVGMLYDCFVVFFLLNARTRIWAYLAVVVFHTLTGLMFQIGVFPLVMIGLTLIYFHPDSHVKFLHHFRKLLKIQTTSVDTSISFPKLTTYLFSCYIIFQVLFPFRYLLYPGKLFWTEEAYRYGWRVMLMEKAGTATFYVKDTKTGREGVVDNSEFLNPHQEKQMAMQADMILQYAHFLGAHYQNLNVYKPEVRAEVYVTLNGKPSSLYIDPNVDLLKIKDTFAPKWWILPYKQEE